MTTQPKALRLAELMLERPHDALDFLPAKAAAELRRLHEELQATERQVEILSDDLSRCSRLNAELLEALQDLCDTLGECGMTERARAAIAKATGEQT